MKIIKGGGAGGGGGGGITSINADVTAAQSLTTGVAGADFAITNPGGGSHVFNLPVASAINTGKLSNTDWITFNSKLSGPGASTDNAVVRWDGITGTIVQNSTLIASDSGDLIIPGMTSIGSSSAYGNVGGVMRFIDEAWTVTDFTAVNSWRIDSARFIVDPDANYAADTATARFSQISIPNTNVNNFGTLFSNNSIADHAGTGTVTQNIAGQSTARLAGAGLITTNVGHNVNITASSTGTGTITNNYGINITSGVSNAAGSVTNDYKIVLRSPDQTGTITNIRALYAEDHSGGGSGYLIYSEGGRSYHAGNLGLNIIAPLSQLHVNGSQSIKRTDSAAGAYAIQLTDYYIAKTGITGGGDTITLPLAATAGAGKVYKIKDAGLGAQTDNITIATVGGDTIDLAATFVMNTNGAAVEVISDGVSNWEIN